MESVVGVIYSYIAVARCDAVSSASDRSRRAMSGNHHRRAGSRRMLAWCAAMACALVAVSAVVPARKAFALSSAGSYRSQISQIKQELNAQGAVIQRIVAGYDGTQSELTDLRVELYAAEIRLAADRRAQEADAAQLRRVAIDTYVSGGSVTPAVSVLIATSNPTSIAVRSDFMSAISGKLQTTLDAVAIARRRTQATAARLSSEKAKASATLVQLARQRQSVQAAIAADDAMLSKARGSLQAVLRAQAAQQQAAQLAAEQAMVHPAVQSLPANATPGAPGLPPPVAPPPVAPPGPPVSVSPGTYANPLRGVSGLSPERIDQGVDYSGFGPIYAIGDGVVLNTVNAGWPGGTFITYRLSSGPAAGLVVYAAEDIYPLVQVGQNVTPNTALGTVYEGPDGIETGWSDPSGQGYTMAYDYNQFSGSNSTAFGYNFSQLLQYLGAPGGVLQNSPPTGSLPAGWPNW